MAFPRTHRGTVCVLAAAAAVVASNLTAHAQTSVTAHSLAELRAYAGLSNHIVTMAPGEYWIEGDRPDAAYITLSGANSVFDFSKAQMKIDTRKLAGYRNASGANSDFDVMHISGNSVTVNGLKLSGHDVGLSTDPNARRYPNKAANYLRISGSNAQLNNAHIITAGSNPYGYGDAFGKGSAPAGRDLPPGEGGVAFLSHNKTCGILLNGWGQSAKIDGLDLDMNTFGHGVYIQGYNNIEIRNSTVTGQLFNSNNVINHPKYQEYGVNVYGQKMFPNIMISGSEDGIRYYGDGSGLAWSQGLIIDNVEVTNMREAFSLIASRGDVKVNNARAYGNETGFEPGLGTVITNSKGDVTNGPLLYYRQGYVDNTNIELELVGDVPQIGRTWDVAYINGKNNVVTLTSEISADLLAKDAYVRVGQRFNDWRHALGDLDNTSLPADGLVLNNLTGQITVLGANGDNVTGFSSAGTINGGDNNRYDGITLVLPGSQMLAKDSAALGNNGTAADGSLDRNASNVASGAALEIKSGVKISNEKIAITGDGVDGKGAIYTTGSVDSGTRFGSSSKTDESTIVLNGDASIGVGVAGNQLLIGQVQGIGNLTKRGPGILAMEKASSFTGDLIVAEGSVSARTGVVRNGLTVNSGASIAGNGDMLQAGNSIARINGTLDLNGRTDASVVKGTTGRLEGTGLVRSSNPHADASSILEITGTQGDGNYTGAITGRVSITKAGNAAQSFDGAMTHTGTTTVTAGTLAINGTHTGGGDYTVSGGTLAGVGSIGSHVIVQSATLAPGRAGSGNVGTLAIGRDLRLASASTVQLDFNTPAAADRVNVGGIATIAGKLSLGTVQPSAFRIGDTVTLVNATTGLTGTFNQVSGVAIGPVGGRQAGLAVTYGPKSVSARVSVLGDATLDDAVGNADIGVVFGNYAAAGATWSRGDFDGDGRVDNRDIGTVFGNYGGTAPATLAAAGVQLAAADRADLVYDRGTGRVTLVGAEAAGGVITNFVLGSDGAFLNTSSLTNPYAGVFFVANASEVSASDPLTAGRPTIDLASLLPAGLSPAQLAAIFTTATYVGALGTGVQNLDLVVAVPEPGSVIGITFLALAMRRRRSSSRSTRATV